MVTSSLSMTTNFVSCASIVSTLPTAPMTQHKYDIVILGAGHAMAVTKPVQLLRVEAEDSKAPFNERGDHRVARDFNRDGDFGTDGDIEAFFRVLGGGSC